MSYDSEVQDEIRKGFLKQIADKFIQHLEKLKDAPDYVKRRWVWELLQNAKDVRNRFGFVYVRIEKYPDRLIFSHNGDPFTIKQLTSLIQQVSSKDDTGEEQDTTGKFGTGFITTHLLSPIILVKGVVCNKESKYKHFEFTLDRSGTSSEELIPKVETALKKLENLSDDTAYPIINAYQEKRTIDNLETQFIYNFVADGKDVAEKGMADLDISLPYTLTFNSSISQVEIIDHEKNEKILYKVKDRSDIGQNKRVIIDKSINDVSNEIRLVTYEGESVTLALNYEIVNDKSRILQPVKDQPRLFRDFPLVGSHNFDYPCVLNSKKFFPTEQRDGLLLKDTSNIKVNLNRSEIKSASNLIPHFIATGLNRPEEVEKLFYLAASAIPGDIKEDDIRKWYEENIQKPLRSNLLDQSVYYTFNNTLIPIRSGKIPQIEGNADKNVEFWEICSFWMPERIPAKEDHEVWIEIINHQYKNWNTELRFTPESLLAEVKALNNIEVLSTKLKGINTYEWLNRLFKLVIDIEKEKLLFEITVVPDQNGLFHKLSELNYDENIPSDLKDVIVLLGTDFRSILADKNLIRLSQLGVLNVKNISESINEKIKGIKESTETESQLRGLFLLSSFIPSELKSSRTKLFNLAKEIFQDSLPPEMKVIYGTTDFNWDLSTKWLLIHLLKRVAAHETVGKLSESRKWDKKSTFEWLNGLINYISSNDDYKNYLEKWPIIPNQYNEFTLIGKLYNDKDAIDDKLKDILLAFDKGNDWKAILLHPEITLDTGREKRLTELASILDDFLKSFERQDLEKYKKEIMTLIEMLETETVKYENPFKWMSANKARVFMDLTVKGTDQQNVFRILKSGKDLSLLAMIAENDIDPVEIERILTVRESAGKERFDNLVRILEEEQADFRFKFQLGNAVEELFKEIINNENLPCEINRIDGAQDFIMKGTNNEKQYYVELKSIGINSDFVRVGRLQASKAAEHPESYSLCIVRRNSSAPDKEYFIRSSKFVTNFGDKIKKAYSRSEEISREISSANEADIHLDFDDPRFKFRIRESVWSDGKDYTNFIIFLKNFFKV